MTPASAAVKMPVLAIAGNPNSGKTTLFNQLTGLRQKVGNYSGVTVERKEGEFVHPLGNALLIDLPGVHSLAPQSEEQRIACDVLLGSLPGLPQLDGALVVLDSTSLEKNLFLLLQIASTGLPVAAVLNMEDELHLRGGEINTKHLSIMLGMPVLSISAAKGTGLESLGKLIAEWPHKSVRGPAKSAHSFSDASSAEHWRVEAKRLCRDSLLRRPRAHSWSDRIDAFVMHKLWGPVIFVGVVLTVFQSIFTWAQPFMDAIDGGFTSLANGVRTFDALGPLQSFLADGVVAGVGSVVVFLPQILIVFFFLTLLENSGYLARAALVIDKLMRRIGLQGKSFIPLISSYACAIPGIMAARTIESRRDRLATLFVAPFMTCSARLPVYALLISAFVPNRPMIGHVFGLQATVLLSLYAVGFLAALITTKILKSTILTSEPVPFTLEIPPYRIPQWRGVFLVLWDRAKIFLKRAGTVILLVNICMWALATYPKTNNESQIETSFAGRLGSMIEPVIRPLGFDWKIGIGLISAQAAREVIISTLSTVYRVDAEEGETTSLQENLKKDMTPLKAFSLMLFFALAMQCVSTLAVAKRETGGWKIPAAMFVYMNGLAYVVCLVFYQVGLLLGFS